MMIPNIGSRARTFYNQLKKVALQVKRPIVKYSTALAGYLIKLFRSDGLQVNTTLLDHLIDRVSSLKQRNAELEYALNLETISAIYDYEKAGKLYTEIAQIRKTLNIILTPAISVRSER
jgi:hypothetical protein